MDEKVRMDRRYDWVGPADKISRIRSIRLRRLPNETQLEANYRDAREELNKWNSNFWAEHNQLFEIRKNSYVEKRKKELGRLDTVSANDLSVFYKHFLNERHKALMKYNKEWYRRNIGLIWPALQVNLIRFKRFLLRK